MSQKFSEKFAPKAEFKCAECGKQRTLDEAEFNFCPRSSSAQQQDAETHYASEQEVVCDNCHKAMHLTFEVWAHSDGTVNATSHSADNAKDVHFQLRQKPEDEESEEFSLPYNENRPLGALLGGAVLGASLGGPVWAIIGGVLGGMLGQSLNSSDRR